MKQSIRCLILCILTLCSSYSVINQKVYAEGETYTLTAVFYDDDDALKKFMTEGLEYEFNNIPEIGGKGGRPIGFNEKIPNPLKEKGMNTIHNWGRTKTITKLIPIDSRRLKDMSPAEYEETQDLLKICMAGIIIFDYSDPKLEIFQKFLESRDCEKFLGYDFTFNHVFKLMGSVKWGNFVGVYTYNASKLTKEKRDKQYSALQIYMGDLERFFKVDNRWNTRCQSEIVESTFRSIADSSTGCLGSAIELFRNEPLVIEYLKITSSSKPSSNRNRFSQSDGGKKLTIEPAGKKLEGPLEDSSKVDSTEKDKKTQGKGTVVAGTMPDRAAHESADKPPVMKPEINKDALIEKIKKNEKTIKDRVNEIKEKLGKIKEEIKKIRNNRKWRHLECVHEYGKYCKNLLGFRNQLDIIEEECEKDSKTYMKMQLSDTPESELEVMPKIELEYKIEEQESIIKELCEKLKFLADILKNLEKEQTGQEETEQKETGQTEQEVTDWYNKLRHEIV